MDAYFFKNDKTKNLPSHKFVHGRKVGKGATMNHGRKYFPMYIVQMCNVVCALLILCIQYSMMYDSGNTPTNMLHVLC